MEMPVLNDAKIRAAKPMAKPYKLTDSNRMYLLVMPQLDASQNMQTITFHFCMMPDAAEYASMSAPPNFPVAQRLRIAQG